VKAIYSLAQLLVVKIVHGPKRLSDQGRSILASSNQLGRRLDGVVDVLPSLDADRIVCRGDEMHRRRSKSAFIDIFRRKKETRNVSGRISASVASSSCVS
jgi:hypothetical protein